MCTSILIIKSMSYITLKSRKGRGRNITTGKMVLLCTVTHRLCFDPCIGFNITGMIDSRKVSQRDAQKTKLRRHEDDVDDEMTSTTKCGQFFPGHRGAIVPMLERYYVGIVVATA